MSNRWTYVLLTGLVLALVGGCGGDDGDSTADGTGDGDGDDGLERLPLQPTKRFVVGATFYLPASPDGSWVLETAPGDNANDVVEGADGYARFTPHVPGAYEFRVDGTDVRRGFTAVANAPFENYNYYPSSSLASVGDDVWVAHTYDPTVSRIDSATGEVTGSIAVGPWPVALAHAAEQGVVLVAHKAGDTVGFVDVAAGRLVDAVWVGDEPGDIQLSADGATAYVALTTEDAIAVVDIGAREVVNRIETNPTPMAMALSEDGATLFVASYRSSVGDRLSYGEDKRGDEFDIAVVDTATGDVRDYIPAVGSVIGGLEVDGDALYVATTRVALAELSGTEGMTAFRHSVARYDVNTLEEVAAVDLGRQDTSTGLAVRPYGMAIAGGTLWVATEGTDSVVGLDLGTLAEVDRFTAEGRPRSILAAGDALYVHGGQAYAVTTATAAGSATGSVALAGDPRSASAAVGQALYTGTGARGGTNHSCADCHLDALTDGNVWSAGGFSESSSRPMFWMEGSDPIGWEGDAADLFSYLWGSPGPTIGVEIDTRSHRGVYDYLASVVPPPAGNGFTARDGSQTPDADAGEALFAGAAGCVGCHAGPMGTNGLRLDGGGTQSAHPTVVPGLVGVQRHSFWLVNGAARTLDEAVAAMLPLAGSTLSTDEIGQVARYLEQLTSREFFVLKGWPQPGTTPVASHAPLRLAMSHPIFDSPDNLALVELRDADGAPVDAAVDADGRYLTVTPSADLTPGATYTLVFVEGFEAFNELALSGDVSLSYRVAAAPQLMLSGQYQIDVSHPNLDFPNRRYDPSVIVPVKLTLTATPTPSGAVLTTDITDIIAGEYEVIIDGTTAHLPPFAIPIGPPGFLNRTFPTAIELRDSNDDGVADGADGASDIRSPGLYAPDVAFALSQAGDAPDDCSGSEGTHDVTVTIEADGTPTIDWTADVEGLGYYVTSPEARTPTGPGPVTGGTTYWAIGTSAFPAGFAGPVAYGEVPGNATDVSETSGAPAGGADLPAGECIKLTIAFTDFSTTTVLYK